MVHDYLSMLGLKLIHVSKRVSIGIHVVIYPCPSDIAVFHWNAKVTRMTALFLTGDVEDKLNRPQGSQSSDPDDLSVSVFQPADEISWVLHPIITGQNGDGMAKKTFLWISRKWDRKIKLVFTKGPDHRSSTPKFVTVTALSCIENSWRSTTLEQVEGRS